MDAEERDLREREFDQRAREFDQQRRSHRATVRTSVVTAVLSVLALVVTIALSTRANVRSDEQFRQQAHDARYNTIVEGLGSSSAAVQTNAMRLLVEFVEDSADFVSASAQRTAGTDAVQTLAAFIEDQSAPPEGRVGLSDYQSPQPIVVSRAIDRMSVLLGDRRLGANVADLSRGDFHGISLAGFSSRGSVQAPLADFRRANLAGLDLRARPSSLVGAFLTCANLTGAKLGAASLSGADLSGADLTGADLTRVARDTLTPSQLTGATIATTTRLPGWLSMPVQAGWGASSLTCIRLTKAMTGMRGGQGYFAVYPCPTTSSAAGGVDRDLGFTGRLEDLVTVCRARESDAAGRELGAS